MLTTYLHLKLSLKMSGSVPLLPLYAFMAWTGVNFIFFTSIHQNIPHYSPSKCSKTRTLPSVDTPSCVSAAVASLKVALTATPA
jgi:hypothetical protein